MNKATPQQEAIYDAIATGKSHVVCEAVAGAGKTTTALGCAGSAIGLKVGMIAFNKHIATELQSRLSGNAKACTLHSLGFAACRRSVRGVELDEGKLRRHLMMIQPDWFKQSKNGRTYALDTARATLDIARLCKMTLTDENDAEKLCELRNHYGIEMPESLEDSELVQPAVVELLEECASDVGAVDFDDMIWMPIRNKYAVEPFDLLMVDEAQDLSQCQQALAFAAGRSGRIIPVGDTRQAIYGFSGADPEAFPRLKTSLSDSPLGARDCPLTVTFRCPKSHVRMARKIVPQIEAAEWAGDGEIDQIDPDAACAFLKPGDLAIARRNAPLVSLTYKLIRSGKPAAMLGRDIGKGLIELLEKCGGSTPAELIANLRIKLAKEIDRLNKKDAPASQVISVTDRYECLMELASEMESISELRRAIDTLFVEPVNKGREHVITLASIHRAKGSESDRVMVLDTECLPMIGKKTKPWEAIQEFNLAYVALTRAKKHLIFAGELPDLDKKIGQDNFSKRKREFSQ